MMFVGELSVFVLFLGFFQCGGSSSALDSFLQGVLRVQQALPQRSRRNVVKRPGVSLDHEDLQELQGVNADIEEEARVNTGLDEASILRELQEVSGSSNLSKRESGKHILSVAYEKALLHAEASRGMRKNKEPRRAEGNAGSYAGMNQFPVHKYHEDNSLFKVRDNYGLKNELADTDYSQVTIVKLQYMPEHETFETTEKMANSVNEVGLVKKDSNRMENVHGSYEMQSGKGEVEEQSVSPNELINYVYSGSLLNEKHVADTYREDGPAHKTAVPEFLNAVDEIQPMNNYESSIEESWETNDPNNSDYEDEPQTIKDKDDNTLFRNDNHLNTFNNDNYNNIHTNYKDGEQRVDISEPKPAKAEPWRVTHLHETNSESSGVNPYKTIHFHDRKISDNKNLRNPMSGVTTPARFHSPSFVSPIGNSHEAGPTPKSDYLNNKPNTNRLADVGTLVTKNNPLRNFVRRYPSWNSLGKERVLKDDNMFAHIKHLQKNDMAQDRGQISSIYSKSKDTVVTQFLHDNQKKIVDTDPEILSVHEAYLKYEGGNEHTLGDLINGELVTDIVRSIMDKVISDVNLRQHIAPGFGSVTKAKANRETKTEPNAEEVYCASRCSVERRSDGDATNSGLPQSKCLALPAELKEFLNWMLEGAKEDVHSESQNLLPDKLIFYPDSVQQASPAVTQAQNPSYDPSLKKKMELVLQLLAEYQQLNDNEKVKVSNMHHYLREELERLQGEAIGASNATTVTVNEAITASQNPAVYSTQSQPVSTLIENDELDEFELIKQQLEMLGLHKNAKLGERLSDRFEYPTEGTQDFSPMVPEPKPLIDNSDSVF